MAKALDKPLRYDSDYVAWLEEQVALLRARRISALDVDNVAEDLESLTKSERCQLANRLEVLNLQRLKRDHQPDQRTNRWRTIVAEQRRRIRRFLSDSPRLKEEVEPICRTVSSDAAPGTVIETQLSETAFPLALPSTVEQIFEREFLADELPDQHSTRKKHR
jgi:hypothetical protein